MASKTTRAVTAAAAMALAVGCSPPQSTTTANGAVNATSSEEAGTPQSKYKLNPRPTQAYQITLIIADAPGPFKSVEGTAQYDVMNENECGEYLESVGVRPRITTNEPFTLTQISEVEYQGTVYVDLMQDANYFGKDVCRWELTEVRARLRATGDAKETRFVPGISAKSVLAQRLEKKYFWKERYPRSMTDDLPSFGAADISEFKPEIHDDLFMITLMSRKVQP